MEEFFEQLINCIRRESRRSGGRWVEPATLAELNRPAANRPAAAPLADEPPRAAKPVAAAPVAPVTPVTPAVPAAPAAAPVVAGSLAELAEQVAACSRCRLAAGRTRVVFGEGAPDARLMFIGEGPGADEDRSGRPFVGRAGQLLDRMIAAMGLRREAVYIANVVKCRPPDNRAPTPEETAACADYLRRQIEFVRPAVIVLLGASAAHALLERTEGITRLRGRWLEYQHIPVMPTYHPAFLLRQESAKRDAWEDLKQVMARLGLPVPPAVRKAK